MIPKYFLTFEQIKQIMLEFYNCGLEEGIYSTLKDCVETSSEKDLIIQLSNLLENLK